MTIPYLEPLVVREPGPRTIPEPPRPGDPGGEPCRLCPLEESEHTIWSDEDWILNHGVQTSLAGAVWLATKAHLDSFVDLPPNLAAAFSAVWRHGSNGPSWGSATWGGCTSTGGVTAAPTSTCGSCRVRSGCSRRRR